MRKLGRVRLIFLVLAIFMLAVLSGCSQKSPGTGQQDNAKEPPKESAQEFYKGKTVEWIIPFQPGDGFDLYPRMIAPYLEKELGATIVIVNKPGGGGTIGYNEVYNKSKRDGLTLSIASMGGCIMAQLAAKEGIQYDLNKFIWLGRVVNEPQVLVVGAKTEYKDFMSLINTDKTLKFSATGTSGAVYLDQLILKLAFNAKNWDIVTGYTGTKDSDLAAIRGEVVGSASSVGSKLTKIKDGDLRPLVLIGSERVPELSDVPTALELATSEEGKKLLLSYIEPLEIFRSIMTTPDVPEDRVQFLRQALEKTLTNPQLIEEATKAGRPISFMPGDKVQAKVKEVLETTPKSFVDELKKVI